MFQATGRTKAVTKEEYIKFHKEFCKLMTDITVLKNADYTGGSGDPFANFKIVEHVGICSAEQGFLTRMMDKMQRLSSFVANNRLHVTNESVADTLLDLANYSILFAGYLQAKSQAAEITKE